MKELIIDNKTPIFQLTVGDLLSLLRTEQKPQFTEKQIPEIFGVDVLGEITGYSKPSIYAKTSKKEIPHFRRDGRLFFRRDEILEWLTENPVETIYEYSRRMDTKLINRRRRGRS